MSWNTINRKKGKWRKNWNEASKPKKDILWSDASVYFFYNTQQMHKETTMKKKKSEATVTATAKT